MDTKVNNINTTFPFCSQCQTYHPQLPLGSKCPNVKTVISEDNIEIDTSKIIVQLRDIFISQIHIKKIKNINKFFSYIVLEITKIIEKYQE
jgi:hypothetical protein